MRVLLVCLASSWISLCSSNSSNSSTTPATPTVCTIDGVPPESFEAVDPVPEPTSPSAALASALDAYDLSRWSDAILGLEPIVNRSVAESEGNRQRAEYALAMAYDRVGRTEESRSLLGVVARNPHHAYRRRAADQLCHQSGHTPT